MTGPRETTAHNYFDSPDFTEIRAHTFRLFEKRNALTRHAIQYNLCELSAPDDRRDPREIQPAFTIRGTPLLRENIGRTRPWDPIEGVFISPRIQDPDVPAVIATVLETCRRFATVISSFDIREMAATIQARFQMRTPVSEIGETRHVKLAQSVFAQSAETVADLSAIAGAPILASITNDLDWLFPDDPRLWKHLARCRVAKAFPVFIARKISIATFPVLKQVAALGLQLHHLFVRDEMLSDAMELTSKSSWPHPGSISAVGEHSALSLLPKLLGGASRSYALQLAYDNIDSAIDHGLVEPTDNMVAKLLAWSRGSQLNLPEKWGAAITRWAAWEERDLLLKPYSPRTWP
ncbi:MAG: hypothetical protein NVSMB53_14240 [Gemmatimonadaceae bacterium]